MKLKKYSLILFCMICTVLFCTGCNKTSEESEIGKFKDRTQYLVFNNFAEADKGMYYVEWNGEYDLLKYIDKKSATETVLCQKVNCKHNSKECQAVTLQPDSMYFLAYSNGVLYSIEDKYNDEESNICLFKRSKDGTGKKLVHKFKNTKSCPNGAALYKGKMILSLPSIVPFDDNTGYENGAPSLVIYDMNTDKETVIIDGLKESETMTNICGGYENYTYFYQTGYNSETGYTFWQYNLETGEIHPVYTGKRNDLQVIRNEFMYLQPEDEKRIESYHISTKNRTTLLEWKEDITDISIRDGYLEFMRVEKEDGTVVKSRSEWYKLNEQNIKSTVYYKWYDLKEKQYLFEDYTPAKEMNVRALFDNGYLIQKDKKNYFYHLEDESFEEITSIS